MAKKAEEKTDALEKLPEAGSGILALSSDGDAEFKQVIIDNFGGSPVTLADLDKMKIPSGDSAAVWSIPSLIEGEDETTKVLEGVLIGWADKKSWWHKSYGESGGKEQPDCKSNDMVHGKGQPNMMFNEKEQALMSEGKVGKAVQAEGGYLCSTCPHNVFGSAPQGDGKACQDKRFVLMLLPESLLPILIRVPATSINSFKQYFKRLAGQRKSYLSVVTGLVLRKVEAKRKYYVIDLKALRFLTAEETAKVRELREPFQAALDAEDAVEAGYTERDPANESLDDMPTHTGGDEPEAPGTAEPEGSDPF